MKKFLIITIAIISVITLSGFTFFDDETNKKSFDLNDLYDYQKKFKTEELEVCADTTAKTYMDYRMTTVVNSRQYQFINNELTIDKQTGFLYDDEGFIAVALGSFYGEIGDRFYFTLESGIVLPLVKAEEKADRDTNATGCYHTIDSSVIEFVIDSYSARDYFYSQGNGLVLNGNYNNYPLFMGKIVKVEKALDELNDNYVSYSYDYSFNNSDIDIFNYASGY